MYNKPKKKVIYHHRAWDDGKNEELEQEAQYE